MEPGSRSAYRKNVNKWISLKNYTNLYTNDAILHKIDYVVLINAMKVFSLDND